jgi:uroporphyrinogen decarboxylase
MFDHAEADRVPVFDHPWTATIERWRREGMPADVNYVDYFDLDRIATISVDNSPRYEERVLTDAEDHQICTTRWGSTVKQWKHSSSTPGFLDFKIVNPDAWRAARQRITPDRDRIDWDRLRREYPVWREKGYWIQGELWFGFDVTHSWMVGTERMLRALLKDPQWCMDIFNHMLEVNLALLDMVWDAGYTFDSVFWPDDMGYKHSQFFSLKKYREVLKPFHQRAVEWAHARGIPAHLHSCGDVTPFLPELVDMGIDALNPLEVKAGMDPLRIKSTYGDRLVLHGGINAVLWDDHEAIQAEMARVIPALKAGGGYIFSSDHSVPSSVSLESFREIVETAKRLGSY